MLRYGSRRDGYDTIRIDELQLSEIDDPASLLGIFPSRPKAMGYLEALAAEHGLCARVLGFIPKPLSAQGSGPRAGRTLPARPSRARGRAGFGAQHRATRRPGAHSPEPRASEALGQVLGLETSENCCISHDAALVHNARLHQALASRRIKAWPFRGPILIEECRPDRTRGHVFILDQWRLLQAMEYDEDGRRPLAWVDPGFDYDRYLMLARHVAEMPRLTPLSAEQMQRLVGELEVAADVS